MSFPLNHKTVFVLDQGPDFAVACDQLELDTHKGRHMANLGYIPPAPVVKTMWTACTEAVLEYCRVVWDIFPPPDKLIRLVVNDSINEWSAEDQCCAVVSTGLAKSGRPDADVPTDLRRKAKGAPRAGAGAGSYNLQDGLKYALEALCEQTGPQLQAREKHHLINRGRVVVLTHLADKRRLQQLLGAFEEQLVQVNKAAAAAADEDDEAEGWRAPLNQVVVDVVHCYPGKTMEPGPVAQMDRPHDVSPIFSYQVHVAEVANGLARKMLCLALKHYDLASTTVTGIPMKEEQNAASSANYDVELFHDSSAHRHLDASELVPATSHANEFQTVTLKWCTPRGSTADLNHCTGAVRITPTDVNSRPSSCLTNFLLSGRSVMLEMPRRSGSKILSHMLTSHGGEIFLHTLSTGRSSLEDPPSISEGPGGRVTDYRITDLGLLMRSNMLAPSPSSSAAAKPSAIEQARQRLARHTQSCPLTISSTTIFNMAVLEPMQRIVVQPELTEEDLAECRKIVYTLLAMENKGEALPVPVPVAAPSSSSSSSAGKAKALKKDEQYRTMFSELETFLEGHAGHSERHRKVLDCLLECRNKPVSARGAGAAGAGTDKDAVELGVALREIERYSAMTEREKSDFNMSRDGVLRSTTTTPLSPPPPSGPPPGKKARGGGSKASLLDMFVGKIQKENAKSHVPFAGQRSLGEKAKLYLSLDKAKDPPKEVATE